MKKKKARENYQKEELLLSMERTILSKERTVLTEITVLLGFLTLGILIIKFFENSPNRPIILFGLALIVFSGITMLFAVYNFKKYAKELKKIEKKDGSEKIVNED